eukprot:4063254-Pyramimonas_sp.AAC.1
MVNVLKIVCAEQCRTVGAKRLRRFTVLKSRGWCSGTIQGRQDATIRLIRGVEIPGAKLRH